MTTILDCGCRVVGPNEKAGILCNAHIAKAVESALCLQGIGAMAEKDNGADFVHINLESDGYFVFGFAGHEWIGEAFKDELAFCEGIAPIRTIHTNMPSMSQDADAIGNVIHAKLNAYVGGEVAGLIK